MCITEFEMVVLMHYSSFFKKKKSSQLGLLSGTLILNNDLFLDFIGIPFHILSFYMKFKRYIHFCFIVLPSFIKGFFQVLSKTKRNNNAVTYLHEKYCRSNYESLPFAMPTRTRNFACSCTAHLRTV